MTECPGRLQIALGVVLLVGLVLIGIDRYQAITERQDAARARDQAQRAGQAATSTVLERSYQGMMATSTALALYGQQVDARTTAVLGAVRDQGADRNCRSQNAQALMAEEPPS